MRPFGGVVYHDVTERKWALKGIDAGVHGLICVNSRAGGHAGTRTPEQLFDELADLGLPLVCAGGMGDAPEFVAALRLGYVGVQLGTRLIATTECTASEAYNQPIVDADESDIVHTERLSGLPLAVINTPYVERLGTRAGRFARWMLKGRRRKLIMRTIYGLRSLRQLRRSLNLGRSTADYWQAGKSVATIHAVEPVTAIVEPFAAAARAVQAAHSR